MTMACDATKNIARVEEFCDIEKEKILFELVILAFWDLNILGYPFDVFQGVLNQFFEDSRCDRDSILKIMEERSKSYFEAWGIGQSGDSLMRLFAAVAKNIDDKLALNFLAWQYIGPFFTSVNKTNAEFLNRIRTKIDIIPA